MEKKELIKRAKLLSQEVDKNCGDFISFILDCMETAESSAKTDEEKKQRFYKILYATKDEKVNLSLLGGGNDVGYGYKNFVKNKLNVSNQRGKYTITNRQLNGLSFEDMKYVFGYVRRLVEIHSKK